MCDQLEDEYHFLLVCKRFTDLSIAYIPKYYYVKPSMVKFIDLITTQNKLVEIICFYL